MSKQTRCGKKQGTSLSDSPALLAGVGRDLSQEVNQFIRLANIDRRDIDRQYCDDYKTRTSDEHRPEVHGCLQSEVCIAVVLQPTEYHKAYDGCL